MQHSLPTMALSIASVEHLEALTQMNLDLRREEESDTLMSDELVKQRMKGFILSDEYQVYLLTSAGVIYGYALINNLVKPKYLRQLFVKKAYRNCGLGSQFMTFLLEALDVNELDVDVMLHNEKAIQFYEMYGFKRRYLGLRLLK